MSKVFISHSWDDNDISRIIAEQLRKENVRIWIDYARIEPGDSLPERIGKALEWCDALVLVWSASAAGSRWVKEEWENAHSMEKRIIPCLLDDTPRPPMLRSRLYIDFRNFDDGFRELLKTLSPEKEKAYIEEHVEKNIEEPKTPITDNEISCNASTGGVAVSIKGNVKRIKAFGFGLSYNPKLLQYINTNKGSLTEGWATVDGNEKKPGKLIVGGLKGAGNPIVEGSDGSLTFIRFKGFSTGLEKGISIQNLTDDVAGMKIVNPLAGFKYEEQEPEKRIERERGVLQDLKQPLREFNQMNRFPDRYRALKCLELASYIEREIEKIRQPEFQKIKNKLLEYAGRKEQIDQNTPLKTLVDLFRKRVDSEKYEPMILCEEIEEALKASY